MGKVNFQTTNTKSDGMPYKCSPENYAHTSRLLSMSIDVDHNVILPSLILMKHVPPYTHCNLYNQSNDRFCGMFTIFAPKNWNCIMILPINYVYELLFHKSYYREYMVHVKPSVAEYKVLQCYNEQIDFFSYFDYEKVRFSNIFVLWCYQRIDVRAIIMSMKQAILT